MDLRSKDHSQKADLLTDKQGNDAGQNENFDQDISRVTDGVQASSKQALRSTMGIHPSNELRKRENLLSRSEAAACLGISSSEFKRRETLGIYTPTYIGDNGWHFFSVEYLSTQPGYGTQSKGTVGRRSASVKAAQFRDALTRSNMTKPDSVLTYEPHIAAKVFRAFNQGCDAADIVEKLLIHPDTVATIYNAWVRMRTMKGGGILVSAETMEIINNLPLPGTYPVTNEAELLANLREASKEAPMCHSCKKKPCRLCATCAEQIYTQPPEVTPVTVPRPVGRPRKSA